MATGLTTKDIFDGAVTAMTAPAATLKAMLTTGTATSPEGMMELSMTVQNYTLCVQTWSSVLKEQFDCMKGVCQKIA